MLSGGRWYSGYNDVVAAPIGDAAGDHGRGGGFIPRRMLHPTTTYHRRRSGLRHRLEETLSASPLYAIRDNNSVSTRRDSKWGSRELR